MGLEAAGIGAAVAAAAGATGVAGTVIAVGVNLAVSAALSAAASALSTQKPDNPIKATRNSNVKSPMAPHEAVYGSVRKGGALFYVQGSGAANTRLHLCIALAAHECDSIEAIFLNGELTELELVTPDSGKGPFREMPELPDTYEMWIPAAGFKRRKLSAYNWRLGTTSQAAFPSQIFECENWTSAHQAKGRCYLYARLVYDVTESGLAWPSFIPSLTVRMKGRKCYDPRTATTVWTDNPANICADILENLLGVPRARIDATAWEDAADICDEVVNIKGGGTEKRYRASGFFAIEGEPENWLLPVARAMAGAVIEHHGTYYIRAGKWRGLTLQILDDDVMGGISVRTAESDRERANIARGVFAGAESYDQPTDFPQVVDAAAVTEDGVEQSMELNLEWCPSHRQAQRVAKILLGSQRFGRTVEIGVSLLKGLDVMPGDTVGLAISSFGLTGDFQVVDHRTEIDGGGMRVVLTLREAAESLFDWDETTEEADLEISNSIIPGSDLEPDELAFTVTTYASSTASAFKPAQITATWADPGNTSFDAIEVEAIIHLEWKTTLGAWQAGVIESSGEVAAGGQTLALDMIDEELGTGNWDFRNVQVERVRVRTRVTGSNTSEWASLEGDLLAPIPGADTLTTYSSKAKHKPAAVKLLWDPPTVGTPAAYDVEAQLSYQWRQGTDPYVTATMTVTRRIKALKLNLEFLDKSKPSGTTSFQTHALNYSRVRSVNADGTVSEWANF
jgi:hypothetical protein